jgi:protein-disulfide isomerase-like protein with CxxC motif
MKSKLAVTLLALLATLQQAQYPQGNLLNNRQFKAGLAVMGGASPAEAYMMQDNPEGYRQQKLQESLEEMKNTSCASRVDGWGNVQTHCYPTFTK